MRIGRRFTAAILVLALALGLLLSACARKGSDGGQQQEPADADARRIRKLVIVSQTQSEDPGEFESARLITEQLKQLGLDVEHRPMPWEQLADLVWYQRDQWDATMWRMVGRPERLDPDELIYNLFHSSTAKDGYNFVGYQNPEYDQVAEQQRVTVDREQRRQLVWKAQEILGQDQPYVFLVYPHVPYAFRNDVWDPASIVDLKGLGIKNFWTFIGATPRGAQKDMVLNAQNQVQAINPLYISGSVDSWITELIWDRLMRMGPDGLPQPWAAESVTWLDDKTVEVRLREGMKWHDGKPVTADDVVFSFEAPMMGDEVPMYKPFVANIDSIEKRDERTVVFKLKQPNAAFETATLAKVNIIPKHVWEPVLSDLANKPENAESYQEEAPVGSGPFKFVHWKPGEEVMLAANPDHWARPKMERWILRFVANTEAALGMLQSGELNFLSDYGGDPSLLQQVAADNPNVTPVASLAIDVRFLALNNRRPPFDDPAFRRAVSLAIPKDAIAQNVYKGFATPATSIITKALDFWHNPNVTAEYDLEKARQVLREAGYEWDGQGRLLYPQGKTENTPPAK